MVPDGGQVLPTTDRDHWFSLSGASHVSPAAILFSDYDDFLRRNLRGGSAPLSRNGRLRAADGPSWAVGERKWPALGFSGPDWTANKTNLARAGPLLPSFRRGRPIG